MLRLLVLISFIAKYRILLEPSWCSEYIDSVLGFFVVEAKGRDVKLDDHVPQVLTQLYAAAKKLKFGSHCYFPLYRSNGWTRKIIYEAP